MRVLSTFYNAANPQHYFPPKLVTHLQPGKNGSLGTPLGFADRAESGAQTSLWCLSEVGWLLSQRFLSLGYPFPGYLLRDSSNSWLHLNFCATQSET